MGRINGSVTQHTEAYEYYIEWEEHDIDINRNISHVTARVYIKCNKHTAYQNNCYQKLWINGQLFENTLYINLSPGTLVEVVSGTVYDIYHNEDGSKLINISSESNLPNGSGYGPLYGSAGSDVWLTHIARYPNVRNSLNSTDLTTARINYSCDCETDWQQFSLNGGGWNNSGGGNPYTIYNLQPNVNYTVKTRCRRTGTDLWGESGTISFTTKDIARISNVSDFEIGNSINITITNPANANINLQAVVNETEIFSSSVKTGVNAIELAEEQQDVLYRQFSNSNEVEVNYILSTNNTWKNSKTAKAILKRKSENY